MVTILSNEVILNKILHPAGIVWTLDKF